MENQITIENKFEAQFDKIEGFFKDKTEAAIFKKTAISVCRNEGFARDNASPAYYRSLWSAIEMIASLGLKPGKQYGHIDMHIEKLKGEEVVSCRPMYQGYLELAYRDPDIVMIKADVVRRGDGFKDNGIGAIPTHERKLEYAEGESKIIGSYAVACYKGGEYVREIMALADLDKIKKHIIDKSYQKILSGIALTWEEEWAKIKVIRRLLKSLRRSYSIEEQTALDKLDNQDYDMEAK
jgi:recombinational DNA repair protein RecT